MLINLPTLYIFQSLLAGFVNLTHVDIAEVGFIDQSSNLTGLQREPDGIAWISTFHYATADKGDFFGGGQGYSIWCHRKITVRVYLLSLKYL